MSHNDIREVNKMHNQNKITVGELAKRANVSIRTLQYYDKIGLLKPSSISEGGRRHYNDNDITILHQIITLKSLGLSLKDIGKRLVPINSTDDVLTMLTNQSGLIEEQISKSQKILESISMLRKEINDSKNVDWEKYSNMVKLINDNNEYYWVINFLEKDILSKITESHESNKDAEIPIDWLKRSMEKAIELQNEGVAPESPAAQVLAAEWWQVVLQYTKGDPKLIEQLYSFYSSAGQWPAEIGKIQKQSQKFMEKTIEHYLTTNNLNVSIEKRKGE